jgi:hypothetical protein
MQEAFGYVIVGVAVLGGLVGVASLVGRGRLYDQIGRGGLSLDDSDAGGSARPPAPSDRDAEIRQMLTARNARRAARGKSERDVEAELAELTRPAADPALQAEVREYVLARNARRVARGREPLDVESEVARQLRDLSG